MENKIGMSRDWSNGADDGQPYAMAKSSLAYIRALCAKY